jgi:hypothetical protein
LIRVEETKASVKTLAIATGGLHQSIAKVVCKWFDSASISYSLPKLKESGQKQFATSVRPIAAALVWILRDGWCSCWKCRLSFWNEVSSMPSQNSTIEQTPDCLQIAFTTTSPDVEPLGDIAIASMGGCSIAMRLLFLLPTLILKGGQWETIAESRLCLWDVLIGKYLAP